MDSMGCRYFWLIFGFFCHVGSLSSSPPKGINWFRGSVEEAFKTAKNSRKPLFLYWGAVWCPPCTKMKKTVFSKPLFQEKIKGFVSVYFDGDQDRAQIWGERLKAKGYPSMIIFNSDGKEVMRLPIGVSVEHYVELLDTVLKNSTKNVGQILKSIETSSPQKIPRQDWSMLAGHAWFQDTSLGLSTVEKSKVLKNLYYKVPQVYKEERYHFFLLYLLSTRESGKTLRKYHHFLNELLKDRIFINKNFIYVMLKLPPIVLKIYKDMPISEREQVEKRVSALVVGKEKTPEEKLLGLYPTVLFKKGNLSHSFENKLIGVVEEVDRNVQDRDERQNIMSTVVNLLMAANLTDKAREYAVKEIKKSASPWYFMGMVADIEQKRGNSKEALEWARKAWNNAKGASTRFAQGGKYLLKMLLLSPNDTKSINGTFKKVLGEILVREDAFSGRNRDVFERLGKAVVKWENKKGRQSLWQNVQKVCKNSCLDKMRGWGFFS